MKTISGYRIMWMMVMFDLPVLTKKEMKAATNFRNQLLDLGFEMAQFSVYTRLIGERENAASYIRNIRAYLPENGKVSILQFTDKQFSEILTFINCKAIQQKTAPQQLDLF